MKDVVDDVRAASKTSRKISAVETELNDWTYERFAIFADKVASARFKAGYSMADFVMPNGKKLRDCSIAYVREFSNWWADLWKSLQGFEPGIQGIKELGQEFYAPGAIFGAPSQTPDQDELKH